MNNLINLIFIFGAKYLYLLVIVIAGAWFLIQPKATKKEILPVASSCLVVAFIIFKIAGYLYYNPRPFVVGNFIPLVRHAADNGFPSHHAFLVALISAVVFIFNRRLGIVLWALALFVSFSRVYTGVHNLIDVLGSIVIAIVAVALVCFFRKTRGRFWVFKK